MAHTVTAEDYVDAFRDGLGEAIRQSADWERQLRRINCCCNHHFAANFAADMFTEFAKAVRITSASARTPEQQ